jgi:hypothetical protein
VIICIVMTYTGQDVTKKAASELMCNASISYNAVSNAWFADGVLVFSMESRKADLCF